MTERPERLGPYELLRLLGRGGMGEVHLARDTRLERHVALKLLPADLADDPARRSRFLREARAAATLNHPNVTTIHEVGEVDGRDYIAQEFVEGRPLNEVLAERPLPLLELAQLAVPLAEALEFAHERGVIHRDLKPANIIVNERGHAKLLDFGLAKVLQGDDEGARKDEPSTTLTVVGAVFGTPSAMSPEQALGRTVDTRSDVFSFGALLYEMATGKPAFLGTTVQETLDKVLHAEPEPLTRLRRDLPGDFVAIVHKALRKDADARYQSMADLAADLRHFKRTTDSGLVPAAPGEAPSGGGARRFLLPAALLVIAALTWQLVRGDGSSALWRLTNPRQLTAALGREGAPVWAPGGTLMAYMAAPPGGERDIWIIQEGSGSPINRTVGVPGDSVFPSFSPDGRSIAFWVVDDLDQAGQLMGHHGLYTMPVLGGAPRLLLDDVYTYGPPQWSADGQRLAFLQSNDDARDHLVRIIDPTGRTLEEHALPGISTRHVAELSWRPGEQHVVFVATADAHTSDVNQLWCLDLATGACTPLSDGLSLVHSPHWTGDGRSLLYVSNHGGTMDVWRQAFDDDGTPTGEPAALTAGLGLRQIALSPDGKRLAYARGGVVANIWRLPYRPDAPATWADARQVTFDEAYIEYADLSPDGSTLVLSSNRAGNPDLWLMPAEGGALRALTEHPTPDWFPRWSPDGREVMFYAYRSGNRDVWVKPVQGGPARQLTTHEAIDWFADWSPDGGEFIWTTDRLGSPQIFVSPVDGVAPRHVPVDTSGGMTSAIGTWLDDGSFLTFWDGDITHVGLDGGVLRRYPGPDPESNAIVPVPGETTLLFDQDEQLRGLDLESGEVRALTDLRGRPGRMGSIMGTDGEQIWFTWVERRGDLWIMDVEDA